MPIFGQKYCIQKDTVLTEIPAEFERFKDLL